MNRVYNYVMHLKSDTVMQNIHMQCTNISIKVRKEKGKSYIYFTNGIILVIYSYTKGLP